MEDMVPHEQLKFANHIREEVKKFGVDHQMWVTVLLKAKECNLELKWCLEQSRVSPLELPKSSLKWPKLSPLAARANLKHLP